MSEEEIRNEDDEMVDIDVTEVSMTEDDIDELIELLEELKETKKEVSYDLDDENELVIKYEEPEPEEDSEEEDDE